MWLIGVEVEQETSAPPPKKNPGSAPDFLSILLTSSGFEYHSKYYAEGKIHFTKLLTYHLQFHSEYGSSVDQTHGSSEMFIVR